MHVTHWFLPWILSTYHDLRVAQLNNMTNDYFSPRFFCVENVWYTLAPCHKICQRQESILCIVKHRCVWSVWSYSYVPVLLAREYKPHVDLSELV